MGTVIIYSSKYYENNEVWNLGKEYSQATRKEISRAMKCWWKEREKRKVGSKDTDKKLGYVRELARCKIAAAHLGKKRGPFSRAL
jgi:hypothetical protein